MFKPDKFEIYELVPQDLYNHYPVPRQELLWYLFDYRLLVTLHNLRKRYGKMVMNTWWWGGASEERGWRHEGTDTGAGLSQHKYGRAGDPKPQEVSPEKIREDILADPFDPDFKYITCLEMAIPWLHIDVRNWDKRNDGIKMIYPPNKNAP